MFRRLQIFFRLKKEEIEEMITSFFCFLYLNWKRALPFLCVYLFFSLAFLGSYLAETKLDWTWQYYILNTDSEHETEKFSLEFEETVDWYSVKTYGFLALMPPIFGLYILVSLIVPFIVLLLIGLLAYGVGTVVWIFGKWLYDNWKKAGEIAHQELENKRTS